MKRAARLVLFGGACAALTGCAWPRDVRILPVVNLTTYDVSCCVVYADVPPSTKVSIFVEHSDLKGTTVTLGAKLGL